MCILLDEGVLFDVSSQNYPIYMKDNFLNSNPKFDYGAFLILESEMKSGVSTVKLFSFSFTQPGTYVFANSFNEDQVSIIKVLRESERCPLEDSILPLTLSSMVTMGLKQRDTILVTPDWFLIGMFLGLVLAVLVIMVLGGYQFQHYGWRKQEPSSIKYKQLAKNDTLDLWNWSGRSSQGSIVHVDNVSNGLRKIDELGQGDGKMGKAGKELGVSVKKAKQPAGRSADPTVPHLSAYMVAEVKKTGEPVKKIKKSSGRIGVTSSKKLGNSLRDGRQNMTEIENHTDFEGFDFAALSTMMFENKQSVTRFFEEQDRKLESFYSRVTHDSNHFKQVLAVKTQVQLNETGFGFMDSIEMLISAEYTAREAFADLFLRKELDLWKLIGPKGELKSEIMAISEADYNILPCKILLPRAGSLIEHLRELFEQERQRRLSFP
jgi:hypothetical protein